MTTVAIQSTPLTEWTKIFPKQVTENYTSSVTFMKQLTVVAVSAITYMKNFPEESYNVENFGGIKMRILKTKSKDDASQFLSTSLMQAFDALEKKYLHQLALCFYEGECRLENLAEYHIFEYTYHSDDVTMQIHSKNRDTVKHSLKCTFENVRERTVHMLRSLVLIMQAYQHPYSPESFDLAIRLYYNDDAPEDYQAPGFLKTSEPEDHIAATVDDSIRVGWVHTPYHKMVAKSFIKETYRASHEAIASQNSPLLTQADEDNFSKGSPSPSRAGSGAAAALHCACDKQDTDDGLPLLSCQYCGRLQHALCFGVAPARAARAAPHCCHECADADPRRAPTDPQLAALPPNKRECLCIYRRTLYWCAGGAGGAGGAPAVDARRLQRQFGTSGRSARKLLDLLRTRRVLEDTTDDPTTPKKINMKQLKLDMAQFFQVNDNDNNTQDDLIAETLSQNEYSDPVGEVLRPMEKVTLQNASSILGRELEDPDYNSDLIDDNEQCTDTTVYQNEISEEVFPLIEPDNIIKGVEKKKNKRRLRSDSKTEKGTEKKTFRKGIQTKKIKLST